MNQTLPIFLVLLLTSNFLLSQTDEERDWDVFIRDSSAYDIQFLNYWRFVRPHPLRISHDSIIVDNDFNDPFIIPTDLPLNKACNYHLRLNDTSYLMIVRRVNYTDIHFSIEGRDKDSLFFFQEGKAILEASFYLGAAGVYEKNEDEYFGMNDYNVREKGTGTLLIPQGTDDVIDFIKQEGDN